MWSGETQRRLGGQGHRGDFRWRLKASSLRFPSTQLGDEGCRSQAHCKEAADGAGMCGPGPPPTFQRENPGAGPGLGSCLILPCRVGLLSPRVLGVCLAWSLLAFQLCLPVSFIHVPSPVVLLLSLACSSELNSSSIVFRKFPWSSTWRGLSRPGERTGKAMHLPRHSSVPAL